MLNAFLSFLYLIYILVPRIPVDQSNAYVVDNVHMVKRRRKKIVSDLSLAKLKQIIQLHCGRNTVSVKIMASKLLTKTL